MKTNLFSFHAASVLAALTVATLGQAQTPQDTAARMSVALSPTAPHVTLQWPAAGYSGDKIQLVRVDQTTGARTSFSLQAGATQFADKSAQPGVSYEYRFTQRLSLSRTSGFYRSGVVQAALDRPLVESRGRVLVLVDETVAPAVTAELEQYAADLTADGWTVVRQELPRAQVSPADNRPEAGALRLAEVQSVKAAVQAFYDAAPATSRALVLIGHLPIPYSGVQAPDGHMDHYGAWPTDLYYGDLTGTWTDSNAKITQTAARLVNVPGDGKFDQTVVPSALELSVGRIDFAGLPAAALSEIELIRQYLQRNHAYRNNLPPFNQVGRGLLVDDHFGYFNGEAFARVGWNLGTGLFGADKVQAGDWFGTLAETPCLVAYGCGGGWFQGASGIGSSADFASRPNKAVFNLLFGSYFGDWDTPDNLLRSAIGGTADSLALVSLWVNRPDWNLSGLALGGTVGDSLKPADGGHVEIFRGILGDPTLRLDHVVNPTAVAALPAAEGVLVTWSGFPGAALGYHVFRSESPAGPFERVSGTDIGAENPAGTPVTATEFLDTGIAAHTTYYYQVRAVLRHHNASGSYLNFSAPVTAQATTGAMPLRIESVLSRKDHGAAGVFDLPVTPGTVEPRAFDGTTELVVTFNQPPAAGNVTLQGLGRIESTTVDGNDLTVLIREVASPQWLTLSLAGFGSADGPNTLNETVTLGILAGDVSQDGVVNQTDVAGTKARIGTPVDTTNAIYDVNADGQISSQDSNLVTGAKRGQLPSL